MKKFFLFGTLLATLALVSIIIRTHTEKTPALNKLALANIEALTTGENSGNGYRPDFTKYSMCGEYMYHPCIYTGKSYDSCTKPC